MSQSLDSKAVLKWFRQHGRHDLPWQIDPTPYRVWVSEIMLQQTQVSTVIDYYLRFMQRFPDVQSLAQASQDEVLHLWTGLGYYARARNLHKTARIITEQHYGMFPESLAELTDLPGIGLSTAGAILALGMGHRGIILDGNVKRVLCRYYAIKTWPGETATHKRLWQLAEAATPARYVAEYTQAMMDLGATVCTRSKPACQQCPLQHNCGAAATQLTSSIPASKPRKTLPQRQVYMLLYHLDQHVLLQQRKSTGLWGGLWSLPEFASLEDIDMWLATNARPARTEAWPVMRHTFSHFHLDITPVVAHTDNSGTLMESAGTLWYSLDHSANVGLAAPVKKLLDQLASLTSLKAPDK